MARSHNYFVQGSGPRTLYIKLRQLPYEVFVLFSFVLLVGRWPAANTRPIILIDYQSLCCAPVGLSSYNLKYFVCLWSVMHNVYVLVHFGQQRAPKPIASVLLVQNFFVKFFHRGVAGKDVSLGDAANKKALPANRTPNQRINPSFESSQIHVCQKNRFQVPPRLAARATAVNEVGFTMGSLQTRCLPHSYGDAGYRVSQIARQTLS